MLANRKSLNLAGEVRAWVLLIVMLVTVNSTRLHAQTNHVYFEAPIIVENGVTLSTQITVNFKEHVFDLAPAQIEATIADAAPAYPNAKKVFQDLELRFGRVVFQKQIPGAIWGDVWRTNKVTGELVRIHEWSQLFYVVFEDSAPIDSIITVLKKLPEVDYAHGPIGVIRDAEPNDPKYLDGTQWNLTKVKASSAWDITQGSTALRIGDVEFDSVPDRNHPDFWTGPGTTGTSKFDGGDLTANDFLHATQVAGIIGAATNDGDGIASLGWNLIIKPYKFTSNAGSETTPGSLANAMSRAIDICDVINCSFTLITSTITNCGGCQLYDPAGATTYPEVQDVFGDAINLGIVVTASMGNTGSNRIKNPGHPDCQTCPTVPFTAHPAAYAGVIGVTATDINDDVPNNYNFNDPDGVPFIDFAGPGIGVLSTSPGGNYYTDSGSSFSAPLVAALAGLMKSINAGLTPSQVQDILQNTCDPINETPAYAGAGRINAYQALLLTHAYSNKSMDTDATAHNSGRRLARDGSGNYHLVFGSGGEIFYRKYQGGSWQPPQRLSSGNGNNKYPSITERGGNLYVVWQRYDGSSYDIFFRKSTNGGTSWGTAAEIRSNAGSSNPLPVIVSPKTDEIVVVYRYGQILESKRSTNNGSSWFTNVITEGTLSYPSVAKVNRQPWGEPTTALVYGKSDTDVYYRYYDTAGSSWSASTNLSSIIPGTATHQTPSLSSEGAGYTVVHVAWHETSGSGLYQNNIIYRKSTGYNSWNSQYTRIYYQDQRRPTITALHSSSVDIIFESNSAQQVGKQHFNGSYWSGPTYIGGGQYPSVSTGSNQAKYVWTSSGSAPYTINISSETLSKEGESGEPYYERVISWLDTTEDQSHITVHVKNLSLKTSNGEAQTLPLQPVSLDTIPDFTPANAFDYLVATPALLPADAESLVVDLSLWTENAEKVGSGANSKISLEFKDDDEQSLTTISGPAFSASGSISEKALRFAVPLATVKQALGSKSVKVNVQIEGLTPNSTTFASLGHIYDFNKSVENSSAEQEVLTSNSLPQTTSLMGSYPNPFNPETTIKYQIDDSGQVRLNIFNLRGQRIRTLVDELRTPGTYEARWDGKDKNGQAVASGIYVIQIQAGNVIDARKITLLK